MKYASADRDGDGVLEFSQNFNSSPGRLDGLYWPAAGNRPASPLASFVKDAGDYLDTRIAYTPLLKGYHFKILKGQGPQTRGGAYDYVINGNMVAGFAVLAYPADYGSTSIMSFIVNHEGDLYQKDLGNHTWSIASGMRIFNPDDSWDLVNN